MVRAFRSVLPPGPTVGVTATTAAGAVALVPQWMDQPLLAAVNLLVTAAFAATALLLAGEPGQAGNGRLFLAAACCWTAGYVGRAAQPGPWALLEWVVGPLTFPVLALVLLRYPLERLPGRGQRVLVASTAGVLAGLRLVSATASRPEQHGFAPTRWWPPTLLPESVGAAADSVFTVVGAGFAVAFVALVVRRLRGTGAIDRRLLAPVATAAVAAAVVVSGEVAGRFLNRGSALFAVVLGVEAFALLAIPAAFLVSAVRRRLAHGAVSELVLALSGPTTPDEVQAALGRGLGDPSLRVLYHRGGAGPAVDPTGTPAGPAGTGRWTRDVIDSDGLPLATLDMHASLARYPELVDAVVSAARLALENSRLQATTRASLREVRRSRTRIVEAGDAERRRLERDLHDGVQQRILAIKVALATARSGARDERERAVLDEARAELQGTLDDLRTLARGIHPAILTEAGLGPAVRAVAERLPLDVDVRVDDGRLGPLVEGAAYYVCCEALANTVKYAGTSAASVRIRRDGDKVTVTVDDRGRGGATMIDGGGLIGLRDRVAAAGGLLTVGPGPDGPGTTVSAVIPCG